MFWARAEFSKRFPAALWHGGEKKAEAPSLATSSFQMEEFCRYGTWRDADQWSKLLTPAQMNAAHGEGFRLSPGFGDA
jgi:hypothetical protein